jgi:hypothetical protein
MKSFDGIQAVIGFVYFLVIIFGSLEWNDFLIFSVIAFVMYIITALLESFLNKKPKTSGPKDGKVVKVK